MRLLLKKHLEHWLKVIAKKIIKKYRPRIIAVTGSFGKTGTKEAIYYALRPSLKSLRRNEGNLNSQWGLPLTVIGAPDPLGSMLKWLSVLLKGIGLLFKKDKNYPQDLILEMGADKPDDISYLTGIARPQVAVLTGIGHTHLEKFGTIDNVAKEKLKLIQALPKDGVAIFNIDNPLIVEYLSQPEVRSLTYGLSSEAAVRGSEINHELNDLQIESYTASSQRHIGGTGFKINYQAKSYQAYLTNVVGNGYIYHALAAMAVTISLNLDVVKAIDELKKYGGVPGRMRLLPGIKKTFIIDDTYNASPEAMIMALETLETLDCQGRKWAVLGEMLELGEHSEKQHKRVGQRLAELNIDFLMTSGQDALNIAKAANAAGFPADRIYSFETKKVAGHYLQQHIKSGDLILIKGSRGIAKETPGTRMEKIVREIMAEPQRAGELLVH